MNNKCVHSSMGQVTLDWISPPITKQELPFITVTMPVRNEERFIRSILEELIEQDYPNDRYEIIVADGESTDSTRRIVKDISKEHPQVILYSNPDRLPSAGRNVGFLQGRGDIFLVIDGHCRINNVHMLQNVADCFERSGADCLGRPQPFVIPNEPSFQRAIALARASGIGHSGDSFIHSKKEGFTSPVSVGCAYRREVFEKIGYVDQSFDACEDVEFNYRVERAHFKTFFSPKIRIYYFARENLAGLRKQLLRYGKGRAKFMVKHPETFSLNMCLPLLFLAGITLEPFAVFISFSLMYIYLASMMIYFITISVESFRLGRGNRLKFKLKLLSSFFVIHTSLGIGLLSGYLEILRHGKFNPKIYYGKKKVVVE